MLTKTEPKVHKKPKIKRRWPI